MIACKSADELSFSSRYYAKVGGIPTAKEMNRLELQFLKYVDFNVLVDTDGFVQMKDNVSSYY